MIPELLAVVQKVYTEPTGPCVAVGYGHDDIFVEYDRTCLLADIFLDSPHVRMRNQVLWQVNMLVYHGSIGSFVFNTKGRIKK